ncbi:hypothetical protein SVIOM74S_00642 [Streptomyces violarus]
MGSYFVNEVTVIDVKPSASGGRLVDLTVTLWCENALPGAERPWELIRTGHLNHTGMWHELAPEDRHAWLSVALWSREYQRQGKPDAPAGQVFTLDGLHVSTGTPSTARSVRPSTDPVVTSAGTWTLWTTV